MTITANRTARPSTFIKSFIRTGADDISTWFSDDIEPDTLTKELRRQGVCASLGAEPVVVMVNDDGHLPGNTRGCVAIAPYGEDQLRTIELAILALESVRDGLREMGHSAS